MLAALAILALATPSLHRLAGLKLITLTGCIMMFVPCLNSSFEFILVFGSRCAILTPSFAFLLWALEKIPVIPVKTFHVSDIM